MLPKKNVPNMNQGCMFLCLVSIALQINRVILENNETKTEEAELNPAAANRKLFVLVLDGLLPSVTQSDSSQDQLDSLGASFPLSLSSVFPPLTLPSTASLLTGLQPHQHNFIDNFLYDSEAKLSFSYNTDDAEGEIDMSTQWWTHFHPIWTHLAKTGEKNVTVYGSNLCKPLDNLECVKTFALSNASLEAAMKDSIKKETNVVFMFDQFIPENEFELKSDYTEVLATAKHHLFQHCQHMKSLAKELDLEDFNVIVTGNRARTADNFYFVNLYDDVLSKSAGNVFNDVSFMPPRIQSQYFSLYSDKNASYLISELEQVTTELKVYSTEELDMRVGSRLSESLYPPQALIVADHHFVMATQAREPMYALLDGVDLNSQSYANTALLAFGTEFVAQPIPVSGSITDVFFLICDVMQVDPSSEDQPQTQSGDGYALAGMLKRNPQTSKPLHPFVVIAVASVICLSFLSMVVFLIIRKQRIESQYTVPKRSSSDIELHDINT
ncbi:glycerophosphocholine choline phosphodiesterase ENPP6-like [Symsagittifera roscoffensis]|uniref:glycerophosphocholine choline phosphodiesterase ENPP6-like n=1 Tax=Symsagittifera roscoffensis TaxID=84072 RepID=UPI00307C3621